MIKRVNNLVKLEEMIQNCQNIDIENVDIEKVKDIKDIKK